MLNLCDANAPTAPLNCTAVRGAITNGVSVEEIKGSAAAGHDLLLVFPPASKPSRPPIRLQEMGKVPMTPLAAPASRGTRGRARDGHIQGNRRARSDTGSRAAWPARGAGSRCRRPAGNGRRQVTRNEMGPATASTCAVNGETDSLQVPSRRDFVRDGSEFRAASICHAFTSSSACCSAG